MISGRFQAWGATFKHLSKRAKILVAASISVPAILLLTYYSFLTDQFPDWVPKLQDVAQAIVGWMPLWGWLFAIQLFTLFAFWRLAAYVKSTIASVRKVPEVRNDTFRDREWFDATDKAAAVVNALARERWVQQERDRFVAQLEEAKTLRAASQKIETGIDAAGARYAENHPKASPGYLFRMQMNELRKSVKRLFDRELDLHALPERWNDERRVPNDEKIEDPADRKSYRRTYAENDLALSTLEKFSAELDREIARCKSRVNEFGAADGLVTLRNDWR